MKLVTIDNNSNIPKYKQIVNSIEQGLINKIIKKGDRLPSINSIRNRFHVSRDTVLMAYSELKIRGIVQSISGKGYYVLNENVNNVKRIFLLFDELNVFKEDLYNSFIRSINNNTQVDIFFHHFNYDLFSKLIYDNIGNYDSYIIMPANLKNVKTIIRQLPKDKVYILDQTNEELIGYKTIFQNFEDDIFNNLIKCTHLIKKYRILIFLFQKNKQPLGLLKGFEKYCRMLKCDFEIINSINGREPKNGEIYVIPDDRNLILILKKRKEKNLKLGKELGIIAYNETLLKEVVEGGITTITTNFNEMGEKLAKMVNSNKHLRIENKSSLIIRNSL